MLEGLISLSDRQMDMVARTAGPLEPSERAIFLAGGEIGFRRKPMALTTGVL